MLFDVPWGLHKCTRDPGKTVSIFQTNQASSSLVITSLSGCFKVVVALKKLPSVKKQFSLLIKQAFHSNVMQLCRFFKHILKRAYRVDDPVSCLKALHSDFDWPYPTFLAAKSNRSSASSGG